MFRKYVNKTTPIALINIAKTRINHLYLIPEINSITKVINKYIRTTPVSGCKNVKIDGIPTTIHTLIKNINSCFRVGVLYFSLKSLIILPKTIINIIFINSLG